MSDAAKMKLDRAKAGLMVIDVQERLSAAMQPEELDWKAANIGILMQGMKALGVPVIITEQYPRGLGATIPEIGKHIQKGQAPLDKVEFSCVANEKIAKAVADSGRTQWILAGMESHVCVYQTARDLIAQGMDAFVVYDAVISRAAINFEIGIRLVERAGAFVTSTETVLFDLLHKAASDEFREISPLVK